MKLTIDTSKAKAEWKKPSTKKAQAAALEARIRAHIKTPDEVKAERKKVKA